MNPLAYRIKADRHRRGDSIDLDGEQAAGLQMTFSLLYVNRGRSLEGAIKDARDYEMGPKRVFDDVHKLIELGVVELNGDVLFLPLSPRTILDRLAAI